MLFFKIIKNKNFIRCLVVYFIRENIFLKGGVVEV